MNKLGRPRQNFASGDQILLAVTRYLGEMEEAYRAAWYQERLARLKGEREAWYRPEWRSVWDTSALPWRRLPAEKIEQQKPFPEADVRKRLKIDQGPPPFEESDGYSDWVPYDLQLFSGRVDLTDSQRQTWRIECRKLRNAGLLQFAGARTTHVRVTAKGKARLAKLQAETD